MHSLTLNNYILNCDLIYKYGKKSIYQVPQVESIFLNLPISKNLKQFASNDVLESSKHINLYLILYFIFFNIPYITFKNIKMQDCEKEFYSVKLILSKQKKFEKCLFEIFNDYYRFKNRFLFEDKRFLNTKSKKKNLINISSQKIFFFNSNELNLYLKDNINMINSNIFFLLLSFKISF